MLDHEYLKNLRITDEPIFNDANTSVNFEFEGSFYILDSEQFFKLFEEDYNEKVKACMGGLSLQEVMEDANIYAVTDIYVDANKSGEMVMSVVLTIEDDKLNAVVDLDKQALEILKDKVLIEMENIKKDFSLNEERAEKRDPELLEDIKVSNNGMRELMETFRDNVNSFINGKFTKENEEQEIDR